MKQSVDVKETVHVKKTYFAFAGLNNIAVTLQKMQEASRN